MNEMTRSNSEASSSLLATLTDGESLAVRALSHNSRRALRSDFAAWAAWAERAGEPVLPARPEAVGRFLLAEADEGKRPATLRRRAASIAAAHRMKGLPSPCAEPVRLALRAADKSRGTQQAQAQPLDSRALWTICGALGDSLSDIRAKAMMMCARDLLARGSELCALRVGDVGPTPEGPGRLAQVKRAKTSTEPVTLYLGPDAAAALDAWLARSGISEKGAPLFQSLTKAQRPTGRPLCVSDVSRIFREAGARVGLGPFSSHSARIGMTCDLVSAGLGLPDIMTAAGWTSPTMPSRYTRKLSAARGAVARFYQRARAA